MSAAVVALTNWSDTFYAVGTSVLDFVCEQPAGPEYLRYTPVQPDILRWKGYEGLYLHMEEGLSEILIDRERLTFRQNGGAWVPLEPVAGGYIAGDLEIAFVQGEDGKTEFLVIGEQPFRRRTEPLPENGPDVQHLEHYAGTYASVSTFEGSYYPIKFFVEDGQLYARRDQQQVVYTFLGGTSFISAWGLATFEEDGVRLYGSLLKKRVVTRIAI